MSEVTNEYFFDVESLKIVKIGNVALSGAATTFIPELSRQDRLLELSYGGSVVDSCGMLRLASLLTADKLDVPERPPKLNTRKWNAAMYIANGRWLYDILDDPENNRQKKLNEKILANAFFLGVGFSFHHKSRFQTFFGSTSGFYQEAGLNRTHRHTYIKDMDIAEAAQRVAHLGKELGRQPTYQDLIRAHSEDPTVPHPQKLNEQFGDEHRSGVENTLDAAGYKTKGRYWTADECLAWAVGFYRRNGRAPKESDIDIASKKRASPSRRIFKKHFGTTANLQSLVAEYGEDPVIEALIEEQTEAQIDDSPVLQVHRRADGSMVKRLAGNRPDRPIKPGSAEAKAIIARVRNNIESTTYRSHTIRGTKGRPQKSNKS